MAGCAGIKASGERCKGIARTGSDYCPAHDPARAEARREAAAKAGRSRPQNTEIEQIKATLRGIADKALAGKVETRVASVTSQVLNVLLRAIEVERKLRETEEFEQRLGELENERGVV